jgi:integrase
MNVAEFAADWPFSHPRPTPETNTHYAYMVRGFASEYRLTPVDGFPKAEATRWGMAHPSAVRYVRAMFADAVNDGLASANPFAGVKVARAPRRRREEHVPSEEQVSKLLYAMPTLSGTVAVALGGYVGLRQSEILAARWPDMYGETIYVHEQLGRNGALKPIKGKVKERTADVFGKARGWLEAAAASAPGNEFIVGLTHSELREQWDAARSATGLRCEFHQLRTFCASWLLELGASPIDVAVQLHGHTDPTVVLSYYAMIDKGKALERLRRVVDGG